VKHWKHSKIASTTNTKEEFVKCVSVETMWGFFVEKSGKKLTALP
jgi:hypothetical protein